MSVVLPAPFGPVTTSVAPAGNLEAHAAKHALDAVPLLEPGGSDHVIVSSATKTSSTMLMRPFTVKNAVFSRRRSPGATSECS